MNDTSSPQRQPLLEPEPGSSETSWDILTTLCWDSSLSSKAKHDTDDRLLAKFYLLRSHRDRMLTAARAFGRPFPKVFEDDAGLRSFEKLLSDEVQRQLPSIQESFVGTSSRERLRLRLRLRILLSPMGSLSVTVGTLQDSPSPCNFFPTPSMLFGAPNNDAHATYRIFVSPHPIKPSLHTAHKTTFRSHYDHLRSLLPDWVTDPHLDNGLLAEVLVVNDNGEIMEGTFTTPYFERKEKESGDTYLITPRAAAGGNIGTTRRWALENGLCKEACIKKEDVREGERVWLSNGVRGWGWGGVEA